MQTASIKTSPTYCHEEKVVLGVSNFRSYETGNGATNGHLSLCDLDFIMSFFFTDDYYLDLCMKLRSFFGIGNSFFIFTICCFVIEVMTMRLIEPIDTHVQCTL